MQLTRKITLLHLVLIQRKEISFSIKSQMLQPAIKLQMFAHLIELYQMKHNIDNFPTLKLKNLRDGTPWTSNFKRTPPLQIITNQLKESIIQGWLIFSINWGIINPHYLLFRGFLLLRVQLSQNITKCLLFIFIHIFCTVLQSTLFIWTIWKRKQTMEHQLHRACERCQNKNKTKSHHIQIYHALYCSIYCSIYCLIQQLAMKIYRSNISSVLAK